MKNYSKNEVINPAPTAAKFIHSNTFNSKGGGEHSEFLHFALVGGLFLQRVPL